MELRDGRVWQGSTAFADLEPASVDGIDAVAVRPLIPGIMDRELARALVTAPAPIDRPDFDANRPKFKKRPKR